MDRQYTAGHQSMPGRTAARVTRPTVRKVIKPAPSELMEDTGTGLDYGTRPDRMPGYLVPNDRFFIRSHAPTPQVDVANWTLRIEGNGAREPVTYTYGGLDTASQRSTGALSAARYRAETLTGR